MDQTERCLGKRLAMPNLPIYIRMPTESEVPYLRSPSCAEVVIGAIVDAQTGEWLQLHGFVVLPEAVELVATPIKQGAAGLVAHLQSETIPPLAILLPGASAIWERRFLQIPLSSQRALDARLAMLLLAPVAAGIADVAAAYPYSSANPRYTAAVAPYTSFSRITSESAKVTSES